MKKIILIFTLMFSLILLSCSSDKKESQKTVEKEEIKLLGAGATFPYPLYSKMFDAYHKLYGVKVNY